MKLSKCSIEFEFNAEGGFDEDEFEEVSVPVRIPEEIEHGLYGHPDFNIITGFKFRGEDVEEYEGEVVDRGYDCQLTFFAVNGGETTVLYSNFNGEEDWQDPEYSFEVIDQIPADIYPSNYKNSNLPEEWQSLSNDEIEQKLDNDANIPEKILIELVLEDFSSITLKARDRAGKIEDLSIELLERLVDKYFDDSYSGISDFVLAKQLKTSRKLDESSFKALIDKENNYLQSQTEERESLIKSAIALNKNLSSNLLEILQSDCNDVVRWSATEGRKLSEELISLDDSEIDEYLSQRLR